MPGLDPLSLRLVLLGVKGAAVAAAVLSPTNARAEWDSEKYLVYALGPVTLRPQLEVAETYDSNLFYSETDEVDDLVTTVRPGAVFQLGASEEDYVSLRYTLDASLYAERDDLNNTGHLFAHKTRYRFSRLTLQAEDRLMMSRTLLGGSFSYIQRRIGQLSLSDNWRADYEVSPRTMLGLSATVDFTDYDGEDLAPFHLYDHLSFGMGARGGFRPSDKVVVFSEFTGGQSVLSKNSPAAPDAPDLSQYGISAGAEGEFTPKLSGNISGGYEIRSYENGQEVPDGWIAGLQLTWRPRPKTTVSVNYRRWIQVSRESLGHVYNAHRPSVSLTQQLGAQGRWVAGIDGYYQMHDYDRPFPVGGQLVDREETMAGVAARMSYRWQPWLLVTAQYDFRTYEDNMPTIPNYDVHRFMLRLAAGY